MKTPRKRPNIVLILTDDHAAHAISAYGSVVNQTPRIDEIAALGRRIDHCYCTNALCTPSRASILTGTHSHVNGVTTLDTPIDASQTTFVSLLKAQGYRTGIVGKWHMGEGEGHDPQDFDYWAVLREQGEYFNPQILSADGVRIEPGYATDIITDLSIDWVNSLEGEEPWCLLIHHKAPHRSWEPDEKHQGMYAGQRIPVPATFDDDYAGRSSAAKHATMRVAEYLTMKDLKVAPPEGLTPEELALWKYQRYMEDYLACVASVDDNVGRVTDWLRERGDFDDTLLMYTSDQGFFLGDHGWFDKRFMYEESILMPLVLSYPNAIEPGVPLEQMVTNVDFAQTILEAAGVEPAERMQGVSFWPQLTHSPDAPTRDGVYYRYYENDDQHHHALAHYGIRTERYKLIYFYNDGMGLPGSSEHVYPPEWELYDMQLDPEELVNVYHSAEYAHVIDELTVQLWQLQASLGDEPHHSQPVPAGLRAAEPAA
ncbi:sulfatase family protein [Microterricola pindariensis]|uniref:Sulfatase n=1 Tax=Microterricola pindariensis TaxID=478010 RepID=A0ABX5AXK9_9MICO|nr:sulfatase [Microterricola pindariensis]PPL19663.1 sulfatase [Microterricola pindariensis]